MTSSAQSADAPDCLSRYRDRVDLKLEHYLPSGDGDLGRLREAIRYAVLGGGKRIRPALCFAAAEALELPLQYVDAPACAIECIHAYSLIHDDLPAMDDDDFRRGRPTVHRAYDEATAILAGDALQGIAFQILAQADELTEQIRLKLIIGLAQAIGVDGMAGGQWLDLQLPSRPIDAPSLETVHRLKTGVLIAFATSLPAQIAGAPEPLHTALTRFGDAIGLAFQIQDDILDTAGAQKLADKPDYPSLLGHRRARERLEALHREALTAAAEFGPRGCHLQELARYLLRRRH